jgi:hypothetical protein
VQIINCEWSLTFFNKLLNDSRFFNNELFKILPKGMPQYDVALTIRYHEMEEAKENIALAPMECYATFPLDGVGEEFDRVRAESIFAMPGSITQWKYGDWAVGVPPTVNDMNTYKILKDYEKKIIKGKSNE